MDGGVVVLLAAIVGFIGLGVMLAILRGRAAEQRQEDERAKEDARQTAIRNKYSPEVAAKIINGDVWQGQTAEQLRDSMGNPADVDRKVLKTKTKETWKYAQVATNRYRIRIMLEDGSVVGWDQK